jgi:hypothetical protein
VHLVGFIIRMYHDERSSECQKSIPVGLSAQVSCHIALELVTLMGPQATIISL